MSNRTINDNSIWVNGIQKDSEGYAVFYPLGTNKVDIPKNSPHWPKGNKLIGQFVYDKNNKLVGFCDTKAMTSNNNGEIIVMPYEEINTTFDSISNGDIQIHAPKATVKKASWKGSGEKVDIPDVQYKYKGCKNVTQIQSVNVNFRENDIVDGCWTELLSDLDNGEKLFYSIPINFTTFISDLSSLTNGHDMFGYIESLTTFISDLSSLTNGHGMFYKCTNLTTFSSNLNSLMTGNNMFMGCNRIPLFVYDLKHLTEGKYMFQNCNKLLSFSSNLKSLRSAKHMFWNCNSLVTFESNLNSLTDGTNMFFNCKLDVPSIKNIIDTINTVETADLYLGMGCDNNQTDKDLFAQEVGYSDMNTLLTALQNKGWTVSAQYTGRPSTNYSLRQPESLPVFVKLEEVELSINDEEIPFYEYTSEDGSKFFNIDWFHETTGSTDGYDVFSSLEEAIAYFNIKQIEK